MSTDNADREPKTPSWWNLPGGGREVLIVALPLVVSSLSWTVMTFFDRMLLSNYSNAAMSAAFAASHVWFALLCLPLGITMYCNAFVSQYYGAKLLKRIGPSVWQGVWFAVAVSPLLLAAIPFAESIFQLTGHEADVTRLEVIYFQILCWGAPALIIAQALASFYSGRGQTRVMMVVDTFVALLNLLLDWLWIFGKWGFPEAGIEGAGWATVVALWVKAAIYLALLLQRSHREVYATLQGMGIDRELFGRLLYYGGPSGWQMLLDITGFTAFVIFVGRLGTVEQEASSMAFSISTLAFMPIWGFAQAAGILVGQHLGENRDQDAARATWTTLVIAMSYMVFISLLYIFAPGAFLNGFFANDSGAVEQSAVWQLAAQLLVFVAAYNLLDAMAMVFVSAIKGAGDTRFVLAVSAVMSVLLVGLSWLGVSVLEFNIYQFWLIISGWVAVMGFIFFFRFLGGAWRSMRVIEQEPPEVETAG